MSACPKCDGEMERGHLTGIGLLGGTNWDDGQSRVLFIVRGTPTSLNPFKAFQQGLADEPPTRHYEIYGDRCSACGYLELFALQPKEE